MPNTPLLSKSHRKTKYSFDPTRESIKYLTSKYTLINNIAEKLNVTKAQKHSSGIDDEEKVFIESKILLEELRQSSAQLTDFVMMKQESIEVHATDQDNQQRNKAGRFEAESHRQSCG